MSELKILLLDIECSMGKYYSYGIFNQNIPIENIIEHPRMIAFSAKWFKKPGTMFFSEYHDTRKGMLDKIHVLLSEADLVVGYNSKNFDVKWIQGEFMVEGYAPPEPFLQLDLLKEIRRNARFVSNKLDYTSGRLVNDNKREYSMARMWRIVDNPETSEKVREQEWNKMKRYAVKDTQLLEPLLKELLPWINMPHPVSEDPNSCHNCGSRLRPNGVRRTKFSTYLRLRCVNSKCGKSFRTTQRINVSNVRPA